MSYRLDIAEWSGRVAITGGRAETLRLLARDPDLTLRDSQRPPAGPWRTFVLMGGRGSGKTRAGAEWVHRLASRARTPLRIALIGETHADAREVMVDGVSGLAAIALRDRPLYEPSRRRLVWPNGSVAQLFSSEDPEALRGPQFNAAWGDEFCKWKHQQDTWDMLSFGLRLGAEPKVLLTTTPRPGPLLKRLMADPGTILRTMATAENRAHLSASFLETVEARYGGTRLGRQELLGEVIEDREDALFSRPLIEAGRIRTHAPLSRIVIGVDPPAGTSSQSVCGIVVAGREESGRGVVLADLSAAGLSPAAWGARIAAAWRRFAADRVVVETNQGGAMVESILRTVDPAIALTSVRASRGKWLRAEPVAALYEQGRVVHCGVFPALEDEMADLGEDGLSAGRSPDRLDALVWALTALMLGPAGEPRVMVM